jgi:hypothetical protein
VGLTAADAGAYFDATFGLNWKPHPNLTVRPEVRWDWFDGSWLPFDNGTTADFFTFGLDAIVAY